MVRLFKYIFKLTFEVITYLLQNYILIKGVIQRDFDDLILALPIIQIFGAKLFSSFYYQKILDFT